MYTILSLIVFNLLILFICFLFARIKKFDFLKIFILTAIISIYYGFRSLNIGQDTIAYYNSYVNLSNSFEIGFRLLSRFIYIIFGDDHRMYFSLINFIMILNFLVASKLIIKYPTYIFTAWIVVTLPNLIFMQISILRQGLALSFFVLGLSLNIKKNPLITIIIFLLSISFHFSSILYIFTYLLTFLVDIKKATKAIFLLIFFILSTSNLPFILLQSFGLSYFNIRLSLDFSNRESLPLFLKISYYLFYFIIIEYFIIDKNSSNKQFSVLSFLIFSTALLFILNDDVFTFRYLLVLDILFPIIILSKSFYFKNKDFFYLTFFSVIIVYYVSFLTQEFILNFGL